MFRSYEALETVLAAMTVLITIFLILPIILVAWAAFGEQTTLAIPPVGMSLKWVARLINDDGWRSAFVVSVYVAFIAGTMSTAASLLGAIGILTAMKHFQKPLEFAFLIPIVFPSVVIAVGQLIAFSDWHVRESVWRLAISHTAVAIPICFLLLSAPLLGPLQRHARLAFALSPTGLYAIFRVIGPLLGAQLLGAFFMAFQISFDEPVLSMFLGGPETQTIPRRIFDSVRFNLDPTAAAVTLVVFISWLVTIAIISFPRKL